MSEAVDGSGATLTFGGFSGDITNISWSGMERAVIESTSLSTTAAKEYIAASLYDAGEVQVEFNVVDDQTGALTSYPTLGAPQAIAFTFVGPAGTAVSFSGVAVCTGMDPMNATSGEKITGSATFKISGAV